MNRKPGRAAFTLIEILIVVILIAIMAATVIPQFANSASDARQSALDSDLHGLHENLHRYKAHHGDFPATLAELAAVSAAGFGPYIEAVPENPVNHSATEAAVASVPTGPNGTSEGWLYMKASGQVWANCDEGFD